MPGYKKDLAYIHDVGFGDFAKNSAPGLLEIMRRAEINDGLVVDLGCGSGIWARELVDAGYDAGIPVLGVTAVGKELTRDARSLGLATRIIAELGAQLVKTYYCEDGFEDVVAGCPVPVIMAGGKKLPELDALTMASNAVRAGAAGVDMGRNIFQSAAPAAMMRAVRAVVHENADPADAYELFREASAEKVLA